MKCPNCKKDLIIDPAGTNLWPCSICQYAWKDNEIKAYWRDFYKNNTKGKQMSEQKANYIFRGFYIPERMMEGIRRYIDYGLRPGRFLSAVICNQLREACMYADEENLHNIPAYAYYFYQKAPMNCTGSAMIMENWIKKHQIEGEKKKEEYTGG